MKWNFTLYLLIGLFVALMDARAIDRIKVLECSIVPARATKALHDSKAYVLHLKLCSQLESTDLAFLHIAIDPNEETKFENVEEQRVRKGTDTMEFRIPIPDWKTAKLSVFIYLRAKNSEPGATPLFNLTKIIEKSMLPHGR
ncbi:MAG TPA: hypothetical protein PLS03_03650 [Terrimicrobiaceae bacterium]|nr:hypothetical protein [Terrimicrobiaceae bacterium]